MSTAVARSHTPDDLLTMSDGKGYELIHGCLVKRNMGAESSEVAGRLFLRLGSFCERHGLGHLWPADNGYQCFPHDRGMVRKPDVSFVRRGRLPGDVAPDGWVKIVPDLVVEVVSPGDTAEELEEKLDDYERARVPLIWVIYPKARKARLFRAEGPAAEIEEDGILSGDEILPGFRCPLVEILPRRTATEPPDAPADPAKGQPD